MKEHEKGEIVPAQKLDDKGRCCGRKPIVYKGGSYCSPSPQRFCDRCCRRYKLDVNEQVENWAWESLENGYFKRK